MNRGNHDADYERFEVGEREVFHDFDGDEFHGYDLPRGDITTRTMSAAEKAAARRRRERLDGMGGFGFGAAA